MTSWDVDRQQASAQEADTAGTQVWYRQMLVFAYELRALYLEGRETQGALTDALFRVRRLTDDRTHMSEELQRPVTVIRGYIEMLHYLNPTDYETVAPRLFAMLAAQLARMEEVIRVRLDETAAPEVRLPAPRQDEPPPVPSSDHANRDKQVKMLQAQNLSFARDMRVVYEAERARSDELRASNARLLALNRAGLRFSMSKSVAELATIGLETAQDICSKSSVRIVILTRPVPPYSSIGLDAVELTQTAGEPDAEGWQVRLHDAIVHGFEQAVVPGGADTDMYVPLGAQGNITGMLMLSGSGQATEEMHASLMTLAGMLSVALDNVRLYADLQAKQATLNRFVSRLLHAQEEERRRVAIDLHDGLAQSIASASHFFESALYATAALGDDLNFVTGTRILREATVEIRRLMAALRPSTLDELGLVPTLRGFVQQMATEAGWMAEFETFGDVASLNNAELEDNIFRIAQEALTNVKKHAAATRVLVRLQYTDGRVQLAVRDWGRGMAQDKPQPSNPDKSQHMGLIGIAERARLLDGTCVIDSALGAGTLVAVTLPVP